MADGTGRHGGRRRYRRLRRVGAAVDGGRTGVDRSCVGGKFNGTVQYEQLHINANLDVTARDIILRDADGQTVAVMDGLTVGWTLPRLMAYLFQGRDSMYAVDRIELDHPVVYLRELADRSWNINRLLKEKEPRTPFLCVQKSP